MNAAFLTDGKITTQYDLLSRSFGIPSGMPRISFITIADLLMRSSTFSSLSSATSGNTQAKIRAPSTMLRFINAPFTDSSNQDSSNQRYSKQCSRETDTTMLFEAFATDTGQ